MPFGGAAHQVLDETKVISHGTPLMNRGLAVGQIVGGIFTMVGGATGEVLGGAASATGIGAAIGVPAMVVSTTLVVGGAANVAAGFRGLVQSMMSTGSGSSGPTAGRSPPNPNGSRGSPAHQEAVKRRIKELEAEGHEHLGGGSKLEKVIPIYGGSKSSRRPDITTRAPDGSTHHENVGRSTAKGEPVARERRALDDIEMQTGKRPGYTAYDR